MVWALPPRPRAGTGP